MLTRRHIILLFVTLMILALTQMITMAQDEPPAPQFLYRIDKHLTLLDGYTGKTSVLPIAVTEKDHFTWSPDGKYIVANLASESPSYFCLNLYDVDKKKWIQDAPISCEVHDFIFTRDGSNLYYAFDNETNGILQKYSVQDKISREVYRTEEGHDYGNGISNLKWSPTGTYLTFKDYHWIMGGTLNRFIVMDIETKKYITVSAPDTYYADYNPVWSADDKWFLIDLKEEYIASFALPGTNHKGDVYLVNADSEKIYRLTYTPASDEIDVHWTADGKIAFTEVTEEKFIYTLDQAMKIEVVPPEKIIEPEEVEESDIQYVSSTLVSPDPKIGVWVKQTQQSDKTYTFEIIVDNVPKESSDGKFAIPISDSYEMIGWRPSDYPYPQPPSSS